MERAVDLPMLLKTIRTLTQIQSPQSPQSLPSLTRTLISHTNTLLLKKSNPSDLIPLPLPLPLASVSKNVKNILQTLKINLLQAVVCIDEACVSSSPIRLKDMRKFKEEFMGVCEQYLLGASREIDGLRAVVGGIVGGGGQGRQEDRELLLQQLLRKITKTKTHLQQEQADNRTKIETLQHQLHNQKERTSQISKQLQKYKEQLYRSAWIISMQNRQIDINQETIKEFEIGQKRDGQSGGEMEEKMGRMGRMGRHYYQISGSVVSFNPDNSRSKFVGEGQGIGESGGDRNQKKMRNMDSI